VIPTRGRNTSNGFYEAFSDLIFCTLVLVLFLLVAIVISLDEHVEAAAEATVKARSARQQLQVLVGSNRFTGRTGLSRVLFMQDASKETRRYWFVPAELHSRFKTGFFGESLKQREERQNKILTEVREITRSERSYSISEFNSLLYAGTSTYWEPIGTPTKPSLGFEFSLVTETGNLRIVDVFPGSSAQEEGLERDDTIVAINGNRPPKLSEANGDTVRLTIERKRPQPNDGNAPTIRDVSVVRRPLHFRRNRVQPLHFAPYSRVATRLSGPAMITGPAADRINKAPFKDIPPSNSDKDTRPQATIGVPTVYLDVDPLEERVTIGGVSMSPGDCVAFIRSASGRGVVIECKMAEETPLPSWIVEKILRPTGFLSRAPTAGMWLKATTTNKDATP
jgi:hypothetical protein